MGVKLVLFDIDGTLMDTNQVDGECFSQAVMEVIGIEKVNTDWSAYKESTDPAIFHELFESFMKRAPSVGEVGNFKRHFVNLLKVAHQKKAGAFKSRSGATKVFEALDKLGWKMGVATGAWKDSAEFKLEMGGFPFEFMSSIATADDSSERTKIVEKAWKEAEAALGKVDRVVYVGDGTWDLKAAAALKIPFIGVSGNPTSEAEIKKRGVPMIPHFEDAAGLDKLLSSAAIATF